MLNQSYAPIFGFSELSKAQADSFVGKYLYLIDKQLIPVIVNEQEEVVGAAITMGCLSQYYAEGKRPFVAYRMVSSVESPQMEA